MLNRKNVPMNLKWKTEDMFENLAEWNALFAKTEKRIDFAKYEGKLNTVETVKACFDELYSVMGDLELLGVYAYMKHDEDSRDSESSALLARIDELEVRFSSAIAFMTPELTALDISVLESFVNDPRLKDYDYEIKGIIKDKAHVLGKEAEGVLAMGGQVFSSFRNIFGMINNADLPFPEITVRGKKIKVSHGTYGVLMQDSDRAVRRKTFKAYYGAFIGLINTIAATYIANVNKNGKVTGKKGGTTKIIATAKDGTKATCKVTVATVKLNASSMPLQVGTSTKALKVASKTVKKDKVKAWKSSDSSIASVSKSGKVTAKKTGKATLTVTMKSGAKATCKVTVQNEKVTTKKLTLSKKKATLTVKQSVKLSVKRNPISAKEKITWSSSNKKVATVSKSGKVTAKKAGKATITAKTSNGKKATCKITVKKATKK